MLNNLIRFWRFDDTLKDDVSGSTTLLTTSGNIGYALGKLLNALSFGGSGFARYATTSSWGVSGGMTLNMYVYLNTTGVYQSLMVRDDVYTGGARAFQLVITDQNKITFNKFNGDGSVTGVTTSTTLQIATWHMVTAVYSPTGGIFIYIDGVLGGSFATANTIADPNVYTKTDLGTFTDSGVWYLQGRLDNVGIWGRALSQAEITQLVANNGDPYAGATVAQNSNFLQFFR